MGGETSEAPASEEEFEERSLAEILDPRGFGWPTRLGLLGLLLLATLPVLRGYGVFVPGLGTVRVNGQLLTNITGAMFFAVFAMSWDMQSGYTGEISFGHGLFFGVGGYTSAILEAQLGLDLLATIPLGMFAAGVAGLLIGFPSLRLQGPYFSLITLVTPLILIGLFKFAPDITGGATGLFTTTLTSGPVEAYLIAISLFLVALALFLAITRSDAGIVLTAIREDELAVEAAGLYPAKFKLFSFVLSGLVGGLAGALFVHTYAGGFVAPSDLLALVISIEVIIASIVGGIGTITGAAIGGLFLFLFRVYLAQFQLVVPFTSISFESVVGFPISEIYFLLFTVVTLLVLFFVPEGIVTRILVYTRQRAAAKEGEGGGGGGDGPDVATDGGWTDGDPSTLERIVAKYTAELRALLPGYGDDR
jgi:branched-chain amino acid transport system permease protein